MLVRRDIPSDQQTVQAVHAAYEAGRFTGRRGLNVVVCSVPDEETLLDYARRLRDAGVLHVLFEEPDLGDIPTALATRPVGRAERGMFANLPLWKGSGDVTRR